MSNQEATGSWQFLHINNDISLAKITKESSSSIIGVLKLCEDEKFLRFRVSSEQIPKELGCSNGVDSISELYNILTKGVEGSSIIAMDKKIIISIQRKKASSVEIETAIIAITGEHLTQLLLECNTYLMRNVLVLNYVQNYTSHTALEKDRAIEFLGNTAKDYGANNAILRWAPENSLNYRALMKYKPELVLQESAPDKIINSDAVNLFELNDSMKNNGTITIKSFKKRDELKNENKSTYDTWESNFSEEELDDDSLLDKFDLKDDLKMQVARLKPAQKDAGSDSDTDLEYESPTKRARTK